MLGNLGMVDKFASDLLRLFNHMHGDAVSDRVTAIVSAAYIETHLTDLIRERMNGLTPEISNRMFGDFGYLNEFARKLDLAFALQILPAMLFEDARLIGRIRNKFAHRLEVDSFEHEKVRDIVDKLKTGSHGVTQIIDGVESRIDADWARHKRFTTAALGVASSIMHMHIKETPYIFVDEATPSDGGRIGP